MTKRASTSWGMKGELCLGMVVGYKQMEARIDALDKSVLPRHTGIIGTTGGGVASPPPSRRSSTVGQAIASFSSFKRPLMIAVDPAPVKRLLVD